MLNKLFEVAKSYIRFTILRTLFLFALFIGLGLFTVLMAVMMYLDWQWKLGVIFAVCLGPWGLLTLILALLTILFAVRYRRKKRKIGQYTGGGVFSAAFSLMLGYLINRKS